MTEQATPANGRLTDGVVRCEAEHVCDGNEAAQQDAWRHDWVKYNPRTATYDTPDGTSVAAELVDNVQCLSDVLHIAQIRANQRAEQRSKRPNTINAPPSGSTSITELG